MAYPKKKDEDIDEGEIFDKDKVVDLKDLHFAPLVFSSEALSVFDAGRELWRYYHKQHNALTDASFYDIRLHFQGTHKDKMGKDVMNNESDDENYMSLLKELRFRMKELARQIAPKIFEYGFLKRNYDPLNQQQKVKPRQSTILPPIDEEAEVEINDDGSKLQGFSIDEENHNGSPVININIEKKTIFEKPVGAVILSGGEKEIKDIIDIKTEE